MLAFGDAIRRIYADGFGMQNVWTFHEAADIEHFRPMSLSPDADVIWIGNWGDEERTRELGEYLISPARSMPKVKFVVHGVRYPDQGKAVLADAGIEFRGYLPNLKAPVAYGSSALTVHVPRRQYTNGLSGIPTIRVFEALACGIPFLCAPWQDIENLFRPEERLRLRPQRRRDELQRSRGLLSDPLARRQIAANGLKTLRERHTCRHRAVELSQIPSARWCDEYLRLRLQHRFLLLEWRRHLLSRHLQIPSCARHQSPSPNPTPTAASKSWIPVYRDYVEVIVYRRDEIPKLLQEASEADLVIKHSGVGADDDVLEGGVLQCRSESDSRRLLGCRCPATLARVENDPARSIS